MVHRVKTRTPPGVPLHRHHFPSVAVVVQRECVILLVFFRSSDHVQGDCRSQQMTGKVEKEDRSKNALYGNPKLDAQVANLPRNQHPDFHPSLHARISTYLFLRPS